MGYIKSSLSENEELLHKFPVHLYAWYLWILLACCLVGIPGLLRLIGTEMGLTSKRVVCKTGLIGRKTNEIQVSKIETVEMNQSILGRILGYGTVKVTGTGISDVNLDFVSNPIKVKNQIESLT